MIREVTAKTWLSSANCPLSPTTAMLDRQRRAYQSEAAPEVVFSSSST
ncbi:hypothetical protein TFLX_00075 [Thermoflexales bacterium]|nr:hypothetical protein TFLX_00075 [Thermoflexales bacterium]